MSKPKARKKYTPEFKAQAVEMVGVGRPVPSVAQDLEIGAGLLYRWLSKPQGAQLRMENEILKKAAVILGTRPQPRDVK